MRIPIPAVQKGPNAQAHPYPIAIALQTQELLQGTAFLAAVRDAASGAFVRQPGAIAHLRTLFIGQDLDERAWEQGWSILGKYQAFLERDVWHGVLVALNSHWDWYAKRLGIFVATARQHVSSPSLPAKVEKVLSKLHTKPMLEQFTLLETATGVTFALEAQTLDRLHEMCLVRNLGMHNQWEVDERYVSETKTPGSWAIGTVREFDPIEFRHWHSALLNAVNTTWPKIAVRYVSAPPYP